VAAKRDAALEPEQEVLPDRVHSLEAKAVETRRDAEHCAARMRRLCLDTLADERPQPARRAVDAVTLGHAPSG
jgi:hypothetical protein